MASLVNPGLRAILDHLAFLVSQACPEKTGWTVLLAEKVGRGTKESEACEGSKV